MLFTDDNEQESLVPTALDQARIEALEPDEKMQSENELFSVFHYGSSLLLIVRLQNRGIAKEFKTTEDLIRFLHNYSRL